MKTKYMFLSYIEGHVFKSNKSSTYFA